MNALQTAIDVAGGQSALARYCGVAQQVVWNWLNRSAGEVPPDRCPAIEQATAGQVTCEALRPDVRWARVPDADWPHPLGRPCIDVAAPRTEQAQREAA
jgi:DNA-binding transcriptional regulator YdaS (Cro superfamily)